MVKGVGVLLDSGTMEKLFNETHFHGKFERSYF
jgi:hypothetical protein